MFTFNCKYCRVEFQRADFGHEFCSANCESKHQAPKLGYFSLCASCKTEFHHYGEAMCCDATCYAKYDGGIVDLDLTEGNERNEKLLFDAFTSNSEISKRGWGYQLILANNKDYCMKYLVFNAGKKFSLHNHAKKNELFYVLSGKLTCILEHEGEKKEFVIKTGDKVKIDVGVIHQLIAIKDSIIIEVSTQDAPEDSYRIEKGD